MQTTFTSELKVIFPDAKENISITNEIMRAFKQNSHFSLYGCVACKHQSWLIIYLVHKTVLDIKTPYIRGAYRRKQTKTLGKYQLKPVCVLVI